MLGALSGRKCLFFNHTDMKQIFRWGAGLLVAGFGFSAVCGPLVLKIARAAAPGAVVINEVGWAGSADSSTDEWIELYNNSAQAVDLAGWHVVDDHGASDYKILSGTIAANGYFLIEDHEAAVSNVTSDAVIDLSLANTGDSLELFDSTEQMIDTVNGSGGMWYAGGATTHASMERIDPSLTADVASNWASSTGGTGAKSSGGSDLAATPGAKNSQAVAGGNGGGAGGSSQQTQQTATATVDFLPGSSTLQTGDVLTITAKVSNAQNLFAYGFDVSYDPSVLQYKSSSEKTFLSENGTVATSFQSGLQNGQSGLLVVADARTVQPKTTVNGSGDLFEIQFDVLNAADTTVQAANGSFLASDSGDMAAQFQPAALSATVAAVPRVSNLSAGAGSQRYSIALAWDAVAGADAYRVYRKGAHGQFERISETAQPNFTDADGVVHGGFLIPSVNYVYQVAAVRGGVEGDFAEVVAHDDRGLKGDNNRSDRVDGRDLEALAARFGLTDSDEGFDPLADTTYDGRIDGSDLIDVGASFARTYQT